MQFISGKFGLAQYINSTGSLGIFDIDGDYKIKFVVTGASPSNVFEVRGRIQGQSSFIVIDTVVSNATKTIKVDEYDFLEIVCTTFSPVQNKVYISGSGFGAEGALNSIQTPNGNLEAVSDLVFTSSDSSVIIEATAPNIINLRSTASGGSVNIDKVTLTSGNILSKSFNLTQAPLTPSEVLLSVGGIDQEVGVDFSIVGSLVSWSGMSLDGILSVDDIVTITYN